jgi:hypothetical protein
MTGAAARCLTTIRGLIMWLAWTAGASAATPTTPDTLFGIRLGAPLEKQFGECPKLDNGRYETGFHKGAQPCWVQDTYGKNVKLPLAVIAETDYALESQARIRTREGNVVEIELFADRRAWRQIERQMLRQYGKPLETATSEHDSRVSGFSRSRSHSWKAGGASLYLTERSGSDKTRIRAVNDDWEAQDSRERQERAQNRRPLQPPPQEDAK